MQVRLLEFKLVNGSSLFDIDCITRFDNPSLAVQIYASQMDNMAYSDIL